MRLSILLLLTSTLNICCSQSSYTLTEDVVAVIIKEGKVIMIEVYPGTYPAPIVGEVVLYPRKISFNESIKAMAGEGYIGLEYHFQVKIMVDKLRSMHLNLGPEEVRRYLISSVRALIRMEIEKGYELEMIDNSFQETFDKSELSKYFCLDSFRTKERSLDFVEMSFLDSATCED